MSEFKQVSEPYKRQEVLNEITVTHEINGKNVDIEYIRKDNYDADINALVQNGISQKQTFDALQKKYDALEKKFLAAMACIKAIDDRIEYREFTKQDIHKCFDSFTNAVKGID